MIRRAFFAVVIAATFALVAACEQLAGVEKYHACTGAECDAGDVDDAATTADSEPATTVSEASTCDAIDAGTATCDGCIATNCATSAESCGCNSTCVTEVACVLRTCSASCPRTAVATNAFLKCVTDKCVAECTCR